MFKILFPLMKEKKWKYVLFMCFSFFNYFLLMLLLTYMQKIVDSIYENGNSLIYTYYILLLIIMYIISTLFMKFYMGDLKIVIDKKINLKLINHLLNLPYIFFDTRKKTDILFTLNHVSYVKEILVSDILNVFLNIGILCVIWVYFFFMNYSMMIALSIVFWGNVFLAFLSQKILTNNMRKLVVENSKVQGYQTEMLYAMFSIKSGCIEGKIFEDWKKKYLTYNRRYGSNERISAIWNTVLTISQILSPLVVLGVWVLFEQRNIVSMGKFVEIFSLTEIFFSQVYGLFNSLMNINMNSVYIERLGDIFFNGVRGNEKKGIKEIHNINSIKIENLCFKYTETSQHILNNISLEINEGECVAIVGRSGSGKSTLLKVISGLYEFSVGKILINGEMSNEIDKKSLVKQIGIVPQEAYLFNKSIYDNLTENQDNISKEQIDKVLRAVGIYDEIVNMPMGVNTLVSEMGTNLSGGQRQRLIIARELLKNPSFLILDEATSTLDYVNEKKILKYISESKITCLLVTHRISSIKNADYILFMENGTIVEEGKHDELIKMRGRYFDMYECKK